MAVSPEKLREIKNSIDIVEIISNHLPLKKAGRRFKALCPFHEDSDPSFYVNPEKQNYRCFGCGASGDVISFLEAIEHLTFIEAVSLLARKAGIDISIGKPSGQITQTLKVNEFACKFFEYNLRNTEYGRTARKYLEKRNFSPELLTKFRIGFAPAGWEELKKTALKESIKEEDLLNAGLLSETRNGKYIDFFRQRIIFPIFDNGSKVVAFGGRVLDDSLPKYINSPESQLFKKSGTLYGFNFARDTMYQKKEAIVTEGYTDVIKAYEKGLYNTVAALGTAFTDSHARLLKRYADTVYVVFDSDSAGVKATDRSLEKLLGQELDIRIISLPGEYDLFDYLDNEDIEEFEKLKNNALDFLEFKYRNISDRYDLNTNQGRAQVADEMLSVVKFISNPVLRDLEIRKIANMVGADESGLKARLGFDGNYDLKRSKLYKIGEELRDMDLIDIMINRADLISAIKEAFPPESYYDSDYAQIARIFYEEYDEKGSVSTHRIFELEDSEKLREKLLEVVKYCGGSSEEERDYEKLFSAWIARKEKEIIARELKEDPNLDLKEYFELKKKRNRRQKV